MVSLQCKIILHNALYKCIFSRLQRHIRQKHVMVHFRHFQGETYIKYISSGIVIASRK